jgi:uncharacterized protein (TIGR02646 family)
MIYINLRKIENKIGKDWQSRADEALKLIEGLPPDRRLEGINSHAAIWQDLKPILDEFLDGKCWYCESRQDRSDNPVDHFRPKGRVAECKDSTYYGYWWLAFKWTNYRFSCTYCNSKRKDIETGICGGKHDHFPLFNEDKRARNKDDNIKLEEPYLLDPTDILDPGLLGFDQTGMVVPMYSIEKNKRHHLRAAESIKIYNLNLSKTIKRRNGLYRYIERKIADGDQFYERYLTDQTQDTDILQALRGIMDDLKDLLDEKAEFSAAAKAYLRGFRTSDREWLNMIL